MSKAVVLIADDDATIRTVVSRALSNADYDVRATGSGAQLWSWIEKGQGDVVLSDVIMPDVNGLDLVPRIKSLRSDLPIIVMSAQNTLNTAVKAAEAGVFEYVPKPFDLEELKQLVEKAVQHTGENTPPKNAAPIKEDMPIVGRSPAMQEIFRLIARVVSNDLTVLITGESGTGKEVVARAIHDMGRRSRGAFVALNMAAIPKDLIESELFGHERGAFTGAHARTQGKFALAQGGTLFLDEIGDMPLEAQTRLLRVLQEEEFVPIGAASPIKTDVRVIAATHQDLEAMVASKQFREDLYFRLNVIPMRLPPLRDRLDDIPDLIRHFTLRLVDEGLSMKTFRRDALERLMLHHWPGNIRELQNLVRRLTVLSNENIITAEMVDQSLHKTRAGTSQIVAPRDESLSMAVERILSRYFKAHGAELPPDGLYARVLKDIERPLLKLCLDVTHNNQLKAAQLLGLNRNTLRKKLRDHDLTPGSSSNRPETK